MAGASVVIGYALAAYSAVSAIKALKEGNILGAVVAGFGAYAGLNMAGAFNTAVAGDALAQSAVASEAGGFSGLSSAAEGATGDLFSGMAESAFTTPALEAGAGTFADSVMASGAGLPESVTSAVGKIGGTLDVSSSLGGLGDSISSTWDSIVNTGKGWINDVGDLISTQDGSILAKAGEAVGGTGNLMKLGGMALDYYGKDKALKAKEDAAEEGYNRSVMEAARKRSSVGAAPGYVYDFGGRKETA